MGAVTVFAKPGNRPHQIGGDKPLGQIGSRSVKHRPSGRRSLPVAGRTFVHPWTRLKPPRLVSTAPGAGKSAGASGAPPEFDTLLLGQTGQQTPAARPLIPPLIDPAILP